MRTPSVEGKAQALAREGILVKDWSKTEESSMPVGVSEGLIGAVARMASEGSACILISDLLLDWEFL